MIGSYVDQYNEDGLPEVGVMPSRLSQLEMKDDTRKKIAESIRDEIKAACSEETFTGEHLHRIVQLASAARPFLASGDPGVARQFGGVLAPSPMTETFGANMLRELVEMMRKSQQKPQRVSDIVIAIAEAKEAGLDDVVAHLKGELEALMPSHSAQSTEASLSVHCTACAHEMSEHRVYVGPKEGECARCGCAVHKVSNPSQEAAS